MSKRDANSGLCRIRRAVALWLMAVAFGCSGYITMAGATELASLEALLVENDIDIARSERSVDIASARERAATASLRPRADIQVTSGETLRRRSGESQRYFGETYSIGATQVIYDATTFLENDRLSAVLDAQRARTERVKQDRRLALVEAYSQWRDAHMRIPLVREQASNIQTRLAQADRLLDSGQISITGVLTIKNELDRALAEAARAQADLEDARSALLALVSDADALSPPQGALQATDWVFGRITFDELPLNAHPEVQEALRNLEAAGLSEEQASKSNWPTISGQLQVSRSNRGSDSAEIPETDTASVQIVATWDFFDSGATKARQAEARFQEQDARLALESARRDLRQARSQADAAVRSARVAWQTAKDELASAQELSSAAERRLASGAGTVDEYLAALERLTEAKIRLRSRWLDGLVAKARQMRHQNALDDAAISALSQQF